MDCIFCGKELTGGVDTFGDIKQEACQPCYLEHLDETPDRYKELADIKSAFLLEVIPWQKENKLPRI